MPKRPHVWITGASKGIGAAIAATLAGECKLTLSSRSEQGLADVVSELEADHCHAVVCDVTDAESVAHAHTRAVERFGRVDILVNNAGIGVFKPLTELSVEEFDQQIDVNLRGVFYCTKAVTPNMIDAKSGMVITINSVATKTAFTNATGYGASKAGALTLMDSYRQEVRQHGIKVSNIVVGATQTDIWPDEVITTEVARMMVPADVAEVVSMLVRLRNNKQRHIEEIVLRPQLGDL